MAVEGVETGHVKQPLATQAVHQIGETLRQLPGQGVGHRIAVAELGAGEQLLPQGLLAREVVLGGGDQLVQAVAAAAEDQGVERHQGVGGVDQGHGVDVDRVVARPAQQTVRAPASPPVSKAER